MRLLVLLDVAADVRIPPQRDPRSGRVREGRLVPELDPGAARALDLALGLASDRPNGHLTALHLGPAENERFLRQALARGCDRAVRVWDEEAAVAQTAGKALILSAAAQMAGFDLILAGNAGVIGGGGQVGVLVAAQLGVACVTLVGAALLSADSRHVEATRELERGFRQEVETGLPAVLTVAPAAAGGGGGGASDGPGAAQAGAEPMAVGVVPARALLTALGQEIPVWTLADLGVPAGAAHRADEPLAYGSPRPRHPRLHPVFPPDPALPAFDRILGLVRGSVKHREGRVVRSSAQEVAQQVFEVLRDEGWLDHLRPHETEPEAGQPSGYSPAGR
jgi:electron transfer flavoprotein alpha/beta subunit